MALRMLCFMVAIGFFPGAINPSNSIKWALLSAGLPLVLFLRWPPRATIPIAAVLSLAILVVPSLGWIPLASNTEAIWGAWQLILFTVAMLIGASADKNDLNGAFRWFAGGLLLSGVAIPVLQMGLPSVFGPSQWLPNSSGQARFPTGLFVNPAILGEALSVAIAALFFMPVERTRVAALSIGAFAVVLFFSGSRNGLLALGLTVLVCARTRPFLVKILWGITGLSLLAIFSPTHISSLAARFSFWEDSLRASTFWGHGVGQFFVAFPHFASATNLLIERPEYAHNEYINTLFEMGVPGALLLVGIFAYALISRRHQKDTPAYAVTVAIASECLFGFPLHAPATFLLGALALGHLLAGARRDSSWGSLYGSSVDDATPSYAGQATRGGLVCSHQRGGYRDEPLRSHAVADPSDFLDDLSQDSLYAGLAGSRHRTGPNPRSVH